MRKGQKRGIWYQGNEGGIIDSRMMRDGGGEGHPYI